MNRCQGGKRWNCKIGWPWSPEAPAGLARRRHAPSPRRARLAVLDRNGEGARAVAAEVGGIAVECDVGDERSIDAALEQVEIQLGPVEVCFSNAGIGGGGDILTGDVEARSRPVGGQRHGQVYAVRKVPARNAWPG